MTLDTVQDYIDRARALLLDQVEPYRYPDLDLVEALNMGMLETRRLRPELLSPAIQGPFPHFTPADKTVQVPMDPQYRSAFVYYICGQAHLRDDEITQDGRAAAFLNKFTAQMLTIQA